MSSDSVYNTDGLSTTQVTNGRGERIISEFSTVFYPVYRVLLGTFILPSRFIDETETALIQADKKQVVEKYVSARLGIGMITGFLAATLLSIYVVSQLTAITFTPFTGAPGAITDTIITAVLGFLTVITLTVTGSLLSGLLGIYASKLKLEQDAKKRASEIDILLPEAVAFMYCVSVGGMPRIEIIREVASTEETYGEVSKEFARIVYFMDNFSEDPHTAIERVAQTTPSDDLSEFLNGLLSTITSGGGMDTYLETQLDSSLSEVEAKQQGELDKLELFTQGYLTISILPMFVLILAGFGAALGIGSPAVLFGITYFLIPLLQLPAVLVLDALFTPEYGEGILTPDEEDMISYVNDTETKLTSGGVAEEYKDEGWLFNQIYVNELRSRGIEFAANPIDYFNQKPKYTFLFTVPITLLFCIAATLTGDFGIVASRWVDEGFKTTLVTLYIPAVLLFAPFTAFYEYKNYKLGKITDGLTNELNTLANTNEQGHTLRDSILHTGESGTSLLSDEFERIYKKQEFGMPISGAIIEANNKYKNPRLARVFRIIKSAQKTSTHITEVLKTAATLSKTQDELESERITRTKSQILVMLIGVVLFVAFIGIMDNMLISTLAGQEDLAASEVLPTGQPVPQNLITVVFYHGAIIQSTLTGINIGYVQSGEVRPGMKYSLGLLTFVMVAWAVINGVV